MVPMRIKSLDVKAPWFELRWGQATGNRSRYESIAAPFLLPPVSISGFFPKHQLQGSTSQPPMEVKILCSCGTKYKFDVDDSVRQLTDPITCPSCGVDGTEAANQYLAQAAALPPPDMAAAQPPSAAAGLRAVPAAPTTGRTIPLPPGHAPRPGASAGGKKKRAYGEPNMALGTAGAIGAGVLGMLIWIGMIKYLNLESGIVAWGLGGLVGFGCRTLGGGYSRTLGLIAGACALVSIVGGGYLGMRAKVGEFFVEMTKEAYEERMAYAKEGVTKATDQEIREFLAKDETDENDQPLTPDKITAAQIAEFKKEIPALKEFIAGKPNKEEFLRELRGMVDSAEMQTLIFKESLSFWTLLWLFLGVGTAWRLGTGEVE